MKRTLQITLAIVLAAAWTGCGPKLPPTEEIKNQLASELPAYLAMQGIDVETHPIGTEGSYLCKYSASVAPKEDLFIKGASKEAIEIQANLLDRSVTGEISESLYNAVSQVVMQFPAQHTFVTLSAEKGKPIVLHGRITASRFGKGWEWKAPEFEPAAVFSAKPRSAFPPNALVEGSPEAAAAVEGLRKKIQEIETAEKRRKENEAAEQAAREQKAAAELAAQKQHLLELLQPGSKFKGNVKSERWPDEVELIVDENSDPSGKPLKFRLINPQDRQMYRDFVGVVDPEGLVDPKIAVAKASGQPAIGRFEDPRARVSGPIYKLYSSGDISVQFFLTPTGLRGQFSGYQGPAIDLTKQP